MGTSSLVTIVAGELAKLPPGLRPQVEDHLREFYDNLGGWRVSAQAKCCLPLLPRVWACSEFATHACLRHPQLLRELIDSGDLSGPYQGDVLTRRVSQYVAQAVDETDLKRRLRELRRRELLRIAWRDLAGWSELAEVMSTLSTLADVCVDSAYDWLYAASTQKYGTPIGEHSGRPVAMVVLGLGKLGGEELNFSSDIDLIFAYPEAGQCTGSRAISNHEFFVQLGRRLINVFSTTTEDGLVFRVDMRLRPNGQSGDLLLSFDAMEQYYQIHGREWERYALIKARVIAGDRSAGRQLLEQLRPFVYRKYIDYSAIEAIREMKAMINGELVRKGMRDNIKLGPGGIREVEFIGQAFQLIRGGRELELQQRSILGVLQCLAEEGHLASATVDELTNAYRMLRTTENRLQMVADRQTHQLPQDASDRLRLAYAMGHTDWQSFERELRHHTACVQHHFDGVFAEPHHGQAYTNVDPLLTIWQGVTTPEAAIRILGQCGFDEPEQALALIHGLRDGPTYGRLSSESRSRLDRLMPLLLAAAGPSDASTTTLVRLIKLIESIGRRSAYLLLLVENPVALSQLVKLYSASAWIASWITQHPVLLDELLHPAGLYAPATRAVLEAELQDRLQHIAQDDLEAQMDVLREFRHGHLLRVAAADIGPGVAPEQVGRHLADIAEVVLQQVHVLAYQALVQRHGEPGCPKPPAVPGFAAIAYGKLGSLELGYGSDLDMIFLYEDCAGHGETRGPRVVPNEVFFSRLGQRLIHMLTTRTQAGLLYEVDMRLRPSGQSGPLVTTLKAFADYQRRHAWTWEQQALVRARAIVGEPRLRRAFETVRREILCMPRESTRLRAEVKEMREKMSAQLAPDNGLFDVKHGRGGIVDIEFMVQYWVLRWAARHPELTDHTDNISILEGLARAGLLPQECTRLLVDAYRRYLATEHHLKLAEQKPLIDHRELSGFPESVAQIWRDVFEQPGVGVSDVLSGD